MCIIPLLHVQYQKYQHPKYHLLVSNQSSIPGGLTWRRDCRIKGEEKLGCREHPFPTPDGELDVYECLCDTDLCNKNTDEGSTTAPTTTKGIFKYLMIMIT